MALRGFEAGACSRLDKSSDEGLRVGPKMMVKEVKYFSKQAESGADGARNF